MKKNNKTLQNAQWIIGCKIVQALIQMVIGMLTARYLGPADYGLINYAASLTAFFTPFMQLGLQSTLVQEYVIHPQNTGEILGTSTVMTICSGFLSMMGVIGFSLVANWGESVTIIVCALYSISLICQASELLQYWFQTNTLSKYSSLAMLCSYIVVSGYKIFLLVNHKSVYWFALSHAVEYSMASLIMFVAYWKIGGHWPSFSWRWTKDLFSRSKYYILAAIMVTVYHNTDHIMLKLLAGNAENGFYTTAVTCICVANFVYYGLIDAARPAILESRQTSTSAFEKNITKLFSGIIWLSLAQSLVFTVFAKPLVLFLYGRDYMTAVPVLRILIWQILFSYMETARNIWVLGTGNDGVLWIVNLCGVLVNVVLNVLLIPFWGACGAAFASVLTQFLANFAIGFFVPQLRRCSQLMVLGLNPGNILSILSDLKKGK